MDEAKIYSIEYECNDMIFAMHIYGTLEEAIVHADNLGLGYPELVEAIIPDVQSMLN